MRRVEKVFSRKTESGKMDSKQAWAPMLSPDFGLRATWHHQQLCEGSERLASFIHITDRFVQPGTLHYLFQVNLELDFKPIKLIFSVTE